MAGSLEKTSCSIQQTRKTHNNLTMSTCEALGVGPDQFIISSLAIPAGSKTVGNDAVASDRRKSLMVPWNILFLN